MASCPTAPPFLESSSVSLSEVDRQLLQRCLDDAPRAWDDFVDRFLGLVVHVANHTAAVRGVRMDPSSREDLVSEVFLTLLRNDRAVLRRFRRHSSLATYLAVIARRVIVRRMSVQNDLTGGVERINGETTTDGRGNTNGRLQEHQIDDRDQVEQLLLRLDGQEADVVRMYHLEGKTYREISESVGLAENSIGSVLSRARGKLRG